MSQTPSSEGPVGGASAEPAAVGRGSEEGSAQSPHGLGGSQLPATGPVVLDASFVIALLQRDPGANALAHVLPRGVMTSITAGEVYAALAGTGAVPQRIDGVLRALGVRIVDLPLAAVHHFPALHRIDTARRAKRQATGEEASALSLGDLCVLGYALATGMPVLTGNQHWTVLTAHGLGVPVHLC